MVADSEGEDAPTLTEQKPATAPKKNPPPPGTAKDKASKKPAAKLKKQPAAKKPKGPKVKEKTEEPPELSWGGVGVMGWLAAHSQSSWDGRAYTKDNLVDYDYQWREEQKLSGAATLFAEYNISRYFALGAEATLAVPTISRWQGRKKEAIKGVDNGWSDWTSWTECRECSPDLMLWAMVRAKFRIPAGRYILPYPLLAVGYFHGWSGGKSSSSDDDFDIPGLGYAGGVGAELTFHRIVKPVVEVRYQGAVAWHSTYPTVVDKVTLIHHAVLVGLGLKFF